MKEPNERQRQVIDALHHNCILFASAGTGKTFTVARRVANILTQGLATPKDILCLTFTIKAANEMKEDILSYAGEVASEVNVNTIHGFCYTLIAEEYKRTGRGHADLDVCDEVDQEEILKNILSTRFYEWKLEKALKERGETYQNLDDYPLVCLQGNEEIYWNVGEYLVDGSANLLARSNDAVFVPVKVHCSTCGEEKEVINGRCVDCGREVSFRFVSKSFEIFTRKTALRNFLSELKHVREMQNYYASTPEEDYQRAYEYLKLNDPSKFEGLTSYYARYLGYAPDEEFVAAMDEFAGKLASEYDERLRLSNLLDFDDLILTAKHILNDEEGGAYWAKRFHYIVVDEMQDTSILEYSVLKKLFAGNNILLCGDFFQTIYGWRGSRPEEILQGYIEEFSATVYMLSENYRATQTLAKATFGYLRNTYPALIGKYCPENLRIKSGEEGEKIFCYAFDNREEEAWKIYRYLLRNRPQNPLETCIVARSNKYIAELSKLFEKFNEKRKEGEELRFFTVEENFQFFKKAVVKDVLAILKLLVNPRDRVSMERVTQKYVRQVGVKSIQILRSYKEIGVSITDFLEGQTYEFGDPYHELSAGFTNGSLVVYDTETTGLDLSKDEAVQISAVKLNAQGEIVDTLDILIEPTRPIDPVAEQTHGFTLEYIRANGGVTVKEGLARFSAFVKGGVLVGHNNLSYDRPLLDRQLTENGLPPLEITAEYDTLLLAKQFYDGLENYKLSTLCERFSVVNEQAHNALGDITATGKCLVSMLKERILPTALERVGILQKYTARFEKFYAFIQSLKERLSRGEELASYIAEGLRLVSFYPERADQIAVRDLVESMQTENMSVAFLQNYLKDASLSGSQMDLLLQKLNRIPIITVHQAKGCEFDTVILAGADDRNFPSYSATQSGGEDEEKKVFYVAISRAKKKLILTRAFRTGRYEVGETPYFWKLPEDCIRQNRAWKNGN